MSQLNNTDQQIQLKTGTVAQITTVANAMGVQGEPLYTTDTKDLLIHNGNFYEVIPSARNIITNNDETVINNDEVVYIGG